MASNVIAQSVLENSLGHLECAICSERFKQPKLLECSHSFCLECLQQLRQNSPGFTKMSCPVCRQETLLKENGIDGLKMNIIATSLLEDIEKQETQLKQQQGKQVPGQELVSKCNKHTGNDLVMYCSKCKTLVCTACITTSHQYHLLQELNAVSDKCKQEARKLIAKITQSIETFSIAIQEIDKSRQMLDSMFAATKEKISRKADEEKQKLMQEAEQIYNERVKKMETARATNSIKMDKSEHKKDDVIQIMGQESCEVVHRMEKLSKDLKEYKQEKSTKVPVGLNYIDFEEGNKSLGRLVLKDELQASAIFSEVATKCGSKIRQYVKNIKQTNTWKLISELAIYRNEENWTVELSPHDIAAYSNNDIVVSDGEELRLVAISAESNFQSDPQELPIKCLTEPSKVTVNTDDDLIVLDGETVKIFSRNRQLLHQFTANSNSSQIAVDDNNIIAIIAEDHRAEIFLYKPDGSFINKLPAPGIGEHLTIYKQQLIYTNLMDRKLVSLDYNGKVIFSVDINQSGRPYGVCCDKDGSIYVVVRKKVLFSPSCADIDHYSPDGKYVESIVKECTKPRCITFTPAGDLVVATNQSVQIYQKQL